MKSVKTIFLMAIFMISNSARTQNNTVWVDYANNSRLELNSNGAFGFSNSGGVLKGNYSMQNNFLMMQDSYGNYYQYSVQTYTDDMLVLIDQYGQVYSYKRIDSSSQNSMNSYASTHQHQSAFPWDAVAYDSVISERGGMQWKERDHRIYVELLQFLIGSKISDSEINSMRSDFVNEFNANPQASIQEIRQIETAMSQVYSQNNIQTVAMIRENMAAEFHKLVQQKPEMNQYKFVQILNRYVQILNIDYGTNLSLSNQDVDAYISYLQFQAMLMGQSYQISPQDRMTLQVKLSSEFDSYPAEQKQTLAFASFIWNIVATQWSSMDSRQQQQYLAQFQSQLYGVSNYNNVSAQAGQEYWNNVNNGNSNTYDMASLESKYRQEAAAKGMSLSQYLDYKQRDMAVNNQIFNTIQNSMMENHATMLNVINNMGGGDDYYYVDYSGY